MTFSLIKSAVMLTVFSQAAAHAAPLLEIRRVGSNVELKWPGNETAWQLQYSDSPKTGPWTTIVPQPSVIGASYVYTQPLTGARFFRLMSLTAGTDVPDPGFEDTNGDGIDGDVTKAIFVATTGASGNPGTRALPLGSIQEAITRAEKEGKDVYVGMGTYNLSSSLSLASGVSVYGQYDPANNWARSAANVTVISGPATAVLGQSLDRETHVEGFTIRSANATTPGGSSYGVRILSSSGGVFVRYNQVEAGNGAPGDAGAGNTDGENGNPGAPGQPGQPDNSSAVVVGGSGGLSAAGRPGGTGGNGGRSASYTGSSGAMGTGGTIGGPGGMGGTTGTDGGAGAFGARGANGTQGAGGADFGTISGDLYVAPAGGNGSAGQVGNGGGGGGGGGGQQCIFCTNGAGNAGGGGGGGAGGGRFGSGGKGGGGSFGVLAVGSVATVSQNVIIARNGGVGGKGGNGGNGGTGGLGGSGGTAGSGEIGRGGQGGSGGDGGHAGSGAGGAGGPSIGLLRSGGTVTAAGNTFTLGSGGAGGVGGTNKMGQAAAGTTGVTAQIR